MGWIIILLTGWLCYGCVYGGMKGIAPEDVNKYPFWMVFVNGPAWWIIDIYLKIKETKE
jgi:hypothetical protein